MLLKDTELVKTQSIQNLEEKWLQITSNNYMLWVYDSPVSVAQPKTTISINE